MRGLRHVGLVAAAAALVVGLSPASASAAALSFSRDPAGGPPGANINLDGQCDGASNGFAALSFPRRSDVIVGVDSTWFDVGPTGHFSTSLTNEIVNTAQYPPEDPIDLEIGVSCALQFRRQPFASTEKTTNSPPTIFTALGAGACGHDFVPEGEDATIPCPAHVKGLSASGAQSNSNFYVDGWEWGASIAVGKVVSNSLDVVTGSGPKMASALNVSHPQGQSVMTFSPYGAFSGGVSVAVGDVNGDGHDEIITGAGPGGGPHVRVFSIVGGDAIVAMGGFYAFDPAFRGGVSVAAADLDGDGHDEIITGAGPGGGPHVRAFSANGTPLAGFFAYGQNFTGGVHVAAGDLVGDTKAEIVTGPGIGGGPHVRVFNGSGTPTGAGFYAYSAEFTGGTMVAVGDANDSGPNEIVTGPQSNGDPHIRVFDPSGVAMGSGFYAYTRVPAGTRVAVAP